MLVAALGLAVIATFLIYRWQQGQRPIERQKVTEVMQPVVAATADIHRGIRLSPEALKLIYLPEKSLPVGYYGSIKETEGRVLRTGVVANEPILASKLAPEGSKAGLYGVIKKDKRAVSVKVNDVIGVAGFVYPGCHVDVLVIIAPKRAGGGGSISKIVLQDIPVLTVGTLMEVKEGEAIPVKVVTLEVTPEQAEKLALSATKGTIRLALRSASDNEIVDTPGITTADLIWRSEPSKKSPKGTVRRRIGVVIRGCAISTQSF